MSNDLVVDSKYITRQLLLSFLSLLLSFLSLALRTPTMQIQRAALMS
jgi:hypothetical protein